MKTGKDGLALIKSFEGCRLKAYKCPAGILTIGYGHTGNVKADMTITQEQADEYLKADLNKFENFVNKLNLNLNQFQFDALVSFTYNCGQGCLNTLVKNRTTAQIADALLLYNKANGKVLDGLTRRRKAERELFLKKVAAEKYKVAATVLNVRNKPSTSGVIIGYLSKGCAVTVEPVGNGWAKYGNGYISMQYLNKV